MQQATVLTKIIADKLALIEEHKQQQPLQSLRQQVQLSKRSFYQALTSTTRTTFILECKKASPSKGLIRPDFNPRTIASFYRYYASVISVLTDDKYFQGSFDFLRQVSQTVKQPLLCKDFIVDPWQIYWARLHQADAILLMLSVLDDESYRALAALAHSLHMGVLTEVISEEECARARDLEAKVVGINNRDLRDLSIDLHRTRMLAPLLPSGVNIISESGIHSYREISELSHYTNGFLIGSALMAETDLNIAVRRMLLGANKVCGLKSAADARAAVEVGAIYGGLVFVAGSPRQVDIKLAQYVISGAALRYIGVFCNAAVSTVSATAAALSLAAVQLHGNEDQAYINALRRALLPDCHIWKSIDMRKKLPDKNLTQVDCYVLDNGGGSGKPFDWSMINRLALDKFMLAGGLAVDNCLAAASLGGAGLDFNSGLESSKPGIKDHHKLATVFQMLRDY